MEENRWKQIEELVERALALPPEDRAAFIDKECGKDETLRNEIHSLLQHQEKAFSFINNFEEQVVAPSIDVMAREKFDEDHRINTQFGHYHITDILGRGGMGIVYKARDTNLDRTVALKFLPSHLTRSDKDRQRFIREAKSAAALNHSNICTIYSVEEYEGQSFISMEYINGQTLREKLEAEDLNPKTALEYGIRISKALAEAHEKGIVHRDIKPGNIMVDSKNRIKVMDFGLAKLVDSKPITQTGTTLGTMAYMSPEQIQGRPVDHRADLFSFGVLLFEMLAGQRPFSGQYETTISHAIVNEEPPLLSNFLSNAPKKLTMLVSRLLEKDPAKRYSDTEQLARELKICLDQLSSLKKPSKFSQSTNIHTKFGDSHSSGSTSITVNFPSLRSQNGMLALMGIPIVIVLTLIGYWLFQTSGTESAPINHKIAVLPLESISTEPEDIQFTDGVHEELINRLAGIGDLTVIARRSVLGFPPDQRQDLQSIAEQLGVSTLMDGTVRRMGDQLRVSVHLIDADNLATLWSGSFDENIDNVFEIQSRIARQVAGELQASLTANEQERLEERPTDNPQAYRYYMQGREYLGRTVFDRENLFTAEEYFLKAIELDRQFASAWGMLANTYYWFYLHDHQIDYLQKMGEAAEWALFFGPDLPETYVANGVYLYWTSSNNRQILSHFETALQKFPNQPMLHTMTAFTHRRLGNWEKLIEYLKKAAQLDPLNTNIYSELAWDYWLIRDYNKSETAIERGKEFTKDSLIWFWFEGNVRLSKDGTLEIYEQAWDHIRPLDPASEYPRIWGNYNMIKRDWGKALEGYKNMQNESFEGNYLSRDYLVGLSHYFWGNRSEAMDYYHQARTHLEVLLEDNPDDFRYRKALGKVYAHLGEDEKAIEEGEKAAELMPMSQDALLGGEVKRDLAEIYAWTGHKELAIEMLEDVLSVPSTVHRNWIRLDPIWDPLRDNPKFQELIADEDEPYISGL